MTVWVHANILLKDFKILSSAYNSIMLMLFSVIVLIMRLLLKKHVLQCTMLLKRDWHSIGVLQNGLVLASQLQLVSVRRMAGTNLSSSSLNIVWSKEISLKENFSISFKIINMALLFGHHFVKVF